MPRFTDHRVAYSLANTLYSPSSSSTLVKKKGLAFDTVNYPFRREGALLAARLTEILFLPSLPSSISAIIPCLGIQMDTSLPPSPAQSISPAPPAPSAPAPAPAQTKASPAPPTPSQTMHGTVADVPTAAERNDRRKARLQKRRERATGVHVSAVRC